jgi:hypothetical protein
MATTTPTYRSVAELLRDLRKLDAPLDVLALLHPDVPSLVELAALAFEKGASLVVAGEVAAVLQDVPVEVLPASRMRRVDFREWFSGRSVPVLDLAGLAERAELGAAAMALVRRKAARVGAESIP